MQAMFASCFQFLSVQKTKLKFSLHGDARLERLILRHLTTKNGLGVSDQTDRTRGNTNLYLSKNL